LAKHGKKDRREMEKKGSVGKGPSGVGGREGERDSKAGPGLMNQVRELKIKTAGKTEN